MCNRTVSYNFEIVLHYLTLKFELWPINQLLLKRVYRAPAERVWKALTNEEDMRKWYFDVSGFKPEVGYEFEFTGGTETEQWRHLCKVIAVEPGKC